MVSKNRYYLIVIFFSMSCSTSKELSGIYIHQKRNIHGDLILINEKSGEVHSWTNDLWIDYRDFNVKEISHTIVLTYLHNDHDSYVLLKRKGGLEKIKEEEPKQRFKKISRNKAKKLIPNFVYQEIFDDK